MTGKTKVVVELTADEDRLLQGFRKAEAADKALRSGLTETGAAGDRSGKAIADAMLKASSTVTRTTNQMLAELRKAGPEGSKIFGRMAGDLVDFEQAGRKSIDTILDRSGKGRSGGGRDGGQRARRIGQRSTSRQSSKRRVEASKRWAATLRSWAKKSKRRPMRRWKRRTMRRGGW